MATKITENKTMYDNAINGNTGFQIPAFNNKWTSYLHQTQPKHALRIMI